MTRTARLSLLACLTFGSAIAGGARADDTHCDPAADYAVPAAAGEPAFSADAVRADLAQLFATIAATHPDPGLSFDLPALNRVTRELGERMPAAMSVREAWLAMARVNPHFHDAHTGLRHPAAAHEAHLARGAAGFPVPVLLDRDGALRVAAKVAPETGLAPHDRIASINGRDAGTIVADLMPRMRGETESIQRLVLAHNFPGHLWTLLGPQRAYCIGIEGGDGIRHQRLPGQSAGRGAGAASEKSTPPFSFSMPAGGVAMLRVGSFDPALKDAFAEFLETSFASLEANGAHTLLIDIRDNPGGAHDVSDQLAAYLTDRDIPTASTLLARITEDNRDLAPDADVGSVVRVPFHEPVKPRPNATAFEGDVFVLVSQDTYSQAIVFAATLKDAGVARIVGEATGGNANQTGQIIPTALANTGLQALSPLYVIYRPSGDPTMAGLQPDIPLAHDPLAPERMVEAALRMIEQGTRP